MHGGEISNTNYRGVSVTGYNADNPSTFVMKGGVIKNNGKSYQKNTSTLVETYPLGGGVYVDNYSLFRMEGGEISGNGVDNMPGSGIFATLSGSTDKFVLNGTIKIVNNSLGTRATTSNNLKFTIGSSFSCTDAIMVDLCVPLTTTAFSAYWKDRQLLIPLSGEDTITIDSALAAKFTPIKYYLVPTSKPPVAALSDLFYSINNSGVVVLTE
jgi:3D (Asp-Asp-Asp) domain-containing protein